MILTNVDYTNRSSEYVTIAMDELAESRPRELLDIVEQDADYVDIKATILKGLAQNVLTKKGLQIHYNGASLGTNIEGVVKHLLKPDYQDIYLSIKSKWNC